MAILEAKPAAPTLTLRVQRGFGGFFEILNGERVLGSSQNEMLAVWTAVHAAEEIAKSGHLVRVTVQRGGREVEEFVAKPPKPA